MEKIYKVTAQVTTYMYVSSTDDEARIRGDAKDSILDEIEWEELNDVNSVISYSEVKSLADVPELHHHKCPMGSSSPKNDETTLLEYFQDTARLEKSRA